MGVAELVAEAKRMGKGHLTEVESAQLLREAGLDVVEMVLAASATEAVAIADRMGFPVVLKVVCSQPIAKLASGTLGCIPELGALVNGKPGDRLMWDDRVKLIGAMDLAVPLLDSGIYTGMALAGWIDPSDIS